MNSCSCLSLEGLAEEDWKIEDGRVRNGGSEEREVDGEVRVRQSGTRIGRWVCVKFADLLGLRTGG